MMARVWDLKGKVIAITGGSSGIGAATAVRCAKAGMHVAIGARRTDALDRVVKQIESCGVRGLAVGCDVADDAQVDAFIDRTHAYFGRLDAVFCNAGLGLAKSFQQTTDEQMRYLFEVNFFGTLRVIRCALPYLYMNDAPATSREPTSAAEAPGPVARKQVSGGPRAGAAVKGQIVICSSAVSELGLPFYGGYCATKAAQDAIASSLRAELFHQGIWVSSVHPIGTKTEFFQRAGANDTGHTHSWFIQTPERVARAVVRGMRCLKAEIWPHWPTRLGMAGCTAMPSLAAVVLKRMARDQAGG